ncbi:sulfotransferase 6B1-like [Carassius carassius]|uniref:sulfotransferase 6B1-like n=1 Tax=Carassius carassius TaxID=217509 RepID=UPI002868D478|nr:sulfotransferase 6B1-like [Carassius carassius]
MSQVPAVNVLTSSMEEAAKMKNEDKLYKREGILYSTILSPPETLDKLKELEAREDDLILVAYPECGFNWMLSVLRKILNASTGKNEIQRNKRYKNEIHSLLENICSVLILVVFRNPKDTLISYYHFMNKNPVLPNAGPWDKFFSDFMAGEVAWGSYFDHALAWEKRLDDPNVMIVTYEELKQGLHDDFLSISGFFNLPLTDEQVSSIAGESTFRAMLENSQKSHGNIGSIFFRKGEVGNWKNHFSDAQSKQMDELFKAKLAGTNLRARLKYDLYCQ